MFICNKAMRLHTAERTHVAKAKAMDLFCPDAGKAFMSEPHLAWHALNHHQEGVQYHCADCGGDFANQCALQNHAHNTITVRETVVFCEPCQRSIGSANAYEKHLEHSKVHQDNLKRTIKCIAYPKCVRKFKSKSGMVAHLESGACQSKLDRKKVYELIHKHDTENVVVETNIDGHSLLGDDSVTSLQVYPIIVPSSIPSLDAQPQAQAPTHPVIFEGPDSDTDSDDEGGVILTPSTEASLSRRESVSSRTSGFPFLSATLIHTPPSGLIPPLGGFQIGDEVFKIVSAGVFSCKLCSKMFQTPSALQNHINSTAHSPRVYHCPEFLFPSGHILQKPQRKFKSLSGLVAHLESGSCEGGEEALGKAIMFVEEKLRDLGLGQLLTD